MKMRAGVTSDLFEKLIALPESRRDLWPDGKTGAVTKYARQFGRRGYVEQ